MPNAIIFCNGRISGIPDEIHRITPNTLVIAADGGFRHCRNLGVTPRIVIGDGDSLDEMDRQSILDHKIAFQQYPQNKDATDFELALSFADNEKAAPIMVLGALGGRWDMSLANLMLAAHPKFQHLRIVFSDLELSVTVIHPHHTYTVKGSQGDLLSLIPVGGAVDGVNLSGCQWPLEGAHLPMGTTRGVSNRMVLEETRISLEKGCLLLMHTKGSQTP